MLRLPATVSEAALRKTPSLRGRLIRVQLRPELTVSRDKLLSRAGRGIPVHAASFMRKRRIVLDADLAAHPGELSRILIHEVFHFVWLRLGNATRVSWQDVLRSELRRHAKGELGWSAERVKLRLTAADIAERSKRWREYCCESFCDSAAYIFGRTYRHREFTLKPVFKNARRRWFQMHCGGTAAV